MEDDLDDGKAGIFGILEEDHHDQQQQMQMQMQEQEQQHHLSSINTTLVIRQLPSQGLSFQLWPAASTLVSLLDHNPSLLLLPTSPDRPLRILELGSGTGLLGIAAAALLGATVTLTDLPHVLPNLRHNALSNSSPALIRQLKWGDAGDMAESLQDGPFDVVIGSDVVYYDHLFDPLLLTLRQFVKGEVVFVMAHLRRWKKRDAVFFRKARKVFDVQVVHTDLPLPGNRTGVSVYRFAAKQSS